MWRIGDFEQGLLKSTWPDFSFQNVILLEEKFRDRIEGESNQSQGKPLDGYHKSLNETRWWH